jgi:hypothetical protein
LLLLCAPPKAWRSCCQARPLKQEHGFAGLPMAGKVPGGVRISGYLTGRLLCALLHPRPALAGIRCLLCLHQVRALPDINCRVKAAAGHSMALSGMVKTEHALCAHS